MENLMSKKFMKAIFNLLPLISILIFSLILRLWWLDKFPVGITYDELEYVLDAKAIFHTGKDISGLWSPLSLTAKPLGVPMAELPSLIVAPFIGPVKLSLFTARFPYAVFNVLLILFIYLISQELLKSKKIALLAALLLSINPWSFHFGRTAFDTPLAILFYLIALYVLLKTHSWKILLSFPFLFLGFFSYIGTKLILLPFVIISSAFHYFFIGKKISKKPYIVLLLLSVFVVSYFIFSLRYQSAGKRTNEILFFATDKAAQAVNMERRLSLPTSLTFFFSNKAVYFLRTFLSKYIGVFSTKFLFLFGEERGAYSMWTHGLFYYIDLIFIIIGILALFTINKKIWLFLISMVAIAPLPSALSVVDDSYVLRSALLYPLLIIFAAYGIYYLIKSNRPYRQVLTIGIVMIYLFSMANYLYLYFFRYPVYGSEGFFYSDRVLSRYISLYSELPEKKIFVISPSAEGIFKEHLFHSGLYTKENVEEIADNIQKGKFKFRNVTFTNACPKEDVFKNKNNVLIYKCGFECEKEITKLIELQSSLEEKSTVLTLSISNLADGGEIYRIHGDDVCSGYKLSSYPRVASIDDFQVENQDAEILCEKWIMNLSEVKK